jgi:hypothetical protein
LPRRVSLPGASELFRQTHADDVTEGETRQSGMPQRRPGTGRVRHDEKITVYVSSDELLALERARLTLRAEYGVAVDRGRVVREAISALLADFAAEGETSELVRRLSSS